jgi:hypothetical protein
MESTSPDNGIVWAGPVESWTATFAAYNEWRTRPQYDRDDIVQEAYFKFAECREKYPTVVTLAGFMPVYCTSVINRVHRMANIRTRRKAYTITEEFPQANAKAQDEIEMAMLLADAPDPIRQLLERAPNLDPAAKYIRYETLRIVDNGKVKHLRVRESTDHYLSRIAGCDVRSEDLWNWLIGKRRPLQDE